MTLIIIYLIFITGFLALIYYSNSKKKAKMLKMLGDLKVNDKIITIGGIYGTINKINEDGTLIIRVDHNVNLTISLSAVMETIK